MEALMVKIVALHFALARLRKRFVFGSLNPS